MATQIKDHEHVCDLCGKTWNTPSSQVQPLVDALKELREWTDPYDHERQIIDAALAKVGK